VWLERNRYGRVDSRAHGMRIEHLSAPGPIAIAALLGASALVLWSA
jgi:hypothetical protein